MRCRIINKTVPCQISEIFLRFSVTAMRTASASADIRGKKRFLVFLKFSFTIMVRHIRNVSGRRQGEWVPHLCADAGTFGGVSWRLAKAFLNKSPPCPKR